MTYSERFSSKFFARLLKPEGPTSPVRDRATSFEIVFDLKGFILIGKMSI